MKTAQAIEQRFLSFAYMYTSMIHLSKEEKLNLLKDITTLDSKGKARRISAAVVANILSVLFPDSNEHHEC